MEAWRALVLLLHAAKQQLELMENNSPMPLSTPGNSWQLGADPEHGGRLAGSACVGRGDWEGGEQPRSCWEKQISGGLWPRTKCRVWLTGAGIGRETTSSAS